MPQYKTEIKITTPRQDYNESTSDWKTAVSGSPVSVIRGLTERRSIKVVGSSHNKQLAAAKAAARKNMKCKRRAAKKKKKTVKKFSSKRTSSTSTSKKSKKKTTLQKKKSATTSSSFKKIVTSTKVQNLGASDNATSPVVTEFSSHSDDSTSTISEDELERSVDMSDDISSNDIIDGGDKKEVKITIEEELKEKFGSDEDDEDDDEEEKEQQEEKSTKKNTTSKKMKLLATKSERPAKTTDTITATKKSNIKTTKKPSSSSSKYKDQFPISKIPSRDSNLKTKLFTKISKMSTQKTTKRPLTVPSPKTSASSTNRPIPPSTPPISKDTSTRRIDTGLNALREAGYIVITKKSNTTSTANEIQQNTASMIATATQNRKRDTKLDTGLDKLKKSGYVVKKSTKTTSSTTAVVPSTEIETAEYMKKRKEEAALAASEAAKRVRLKKKQITEAQSKKMEDKTASSILARKAEERQVAEQLRLLKRARIYAMNCLMEGYRKIQIFNFHRDAKKENEIVGGKGEEVSEKKDKEKGEEKEVNELEKESKAENKEERVGEETVK